MKRIIAVLGMLFSLFCCAQKPRFTSYAPAEFERALKEDPAIQLVDVRRPDEFEAGHINNAILINVLEADFISKVDAMLDKSRPVAVYCRSGKRSKDAAEKLSKKGFVVYDLDSGYLGWMDFINSK